MMYMKERIFEVDEEGEEKVVDESSTNSFKRIEKMEDRKTAKCIKRAVRDEHLRYSHDKDTLMSLGEYCFTNPDEITRSRCYQQEC